MQTSEIGLRERKRTETRARLETAAVELALKVGLEHATIDAICERADVSSRTFFNYFDSKDDAVLGYKDTTIGADEVTALLARHDGADLIELSVRLIFRILSPSVTSSKLMKSRMTILRVNPQLHGRMADQIQRMTVQLTSALRPLVASSAGFRDDTPETSDTSVEVLLALCSGAVRASVKEWSVNGNTTPLEAVEERAIALVRTTVKRLA